MSKRCAFCQGSKIELIKLPYTLFRHLGFVDYRKSGMIGRCKDCQLLINIMSEADEKKQAQIYESLDYAKAPITNQTFLLKPNRRVTRFFLQGELLKGFLRNSKETKVLDIGCFKGELLLELNGRFPKAEFHGFDVNRHLKKCFPSKKNFVFHLADLSKIKGEFDLICMSLSMIYIKDIQGLLVNVRRLLKKEGKLFIQLPDVTNNPCSILLADQYYYFTPSILRNVLHKAGFDMVLLPNEHFPRDIVAIAQATSSNKTSQIKKDTSIYRTMKYLDRVKRQLLTISQPKTCVLGTTTTAAFVESVLGNRIEFFVDENMKSKNESRRFRGKPVINPALLDSSVHLILPYGPANGSIKKRFSREYQLKSFKLI